MRSWILWLLIAAVVVGVAVTLSVTGLPTGEPRKYLSAKVTMGRVETVVNSTGTVKPVKLISVGAFTSGPIQKIYVDFRDEVTKGKDLALIDPKLQTSIVASDKANVAAQEAELLRVKALLKKAENEEERAGNCARAARIIFRIPTWTRSISRGWRRRPRSSSPRPTSFRLRPSWKTPRPSSPIPTSSLPTTALSSNARWMKARPWPRLSRHPSFSPSPRKWTR